MWQFAARKNRHGQGVAVGSAGDVAAAVGELVELIAPDGQHAYGRIRSTGRAWAGPDGTPSAYGYLDPTSLTPAA